MNLWTNAIGLAERSYAASPVWLQTLAVSAYGWRARRLRSGPEFERFCRGYTEREHWSADQMHAFVNQQLRAQVRRAYEEIPYYRHAFRAAGVTDDFIERVSTDDLATLPLLESSVNRTGPARLLSRAASHHAPPADFTSGTGGEPAAVYGDRATRQLGIAAREVRSYRWAGVSGRDSRATLGFRSVVAATHHAPPFWRHNYWDRQTYLSLFHLSVANASDYVNALNRFRPRWITGLPTGLYYLARHIRELGLDVHSPAAIVTWGERLEPQMRAELETTFRTRAFEEYGSAENCALATECERGRLHVSPDFGHLEILRPDGRPAAAGEIGEFVVTGFANPHHVFVRLRIGDVGAWAADACPCGRDTLPTLERVVGRAGDTLVLPGGRRLARQAIFRGLPGIAEGQIVQEAMDRLVMRVETTAAFSDVDRLAIRARVDGLFGPGTHVEIHPVDRIPRGPNGKYRTVISRIGETLMGPFVDDDDPATRS